MGNLWLNASNKIVTDGSGKPIECAACPCGLASGIYAVGDFTTADGVTVNGVGFWDGANWHALGAGFGGGAAGYTAAYVCLVWNSKLVVFGRFTTADGVSCGNVATWDGTAWAAMGTSFGSFTEVVTAAVYSGVLVAAVLGGVPQYWTGTVWANLGSWPGTNGVQSLAVTADGLVACEVVASAAGTNVRVWNGSTWSPMGFPNDVPGGGHPISYRAVKGVSNVTVIGVHKPATTEQGAALVQKYSGGAWTSIGNAFNVSNHVWASGRPALNSGLALSSDLYAGCILANGAGGLLSSAFSKLNGTTWTALGSVNDVVNEMDYDAAAGNIVIVGNFTGPFNRISLYNVAGNSFSGLGSGFNSTAFGVCVVP